MLPKPTPFDLDYFSLHTVYARQQEVIVLNKKAHDDYLLKSSNWVAENTQNRILGRILTYLPPLPLEIVVTDMGEESLKRFDDLTPPTLPVENIIPSTGSIKADPTKIPPDRLDLVIEMLKVLREEQVQLEARLVSLLRD